MLVLLLVLNQNVLLTSFSEARRRYTSAMSATHNNLVTEDNNARAALTIEALLADEHGSSANSLAAIRIESPEKQDENLYLLTNLLAVTYKNCKLRILTKYCT